ncbi:hypothetical protein [Methylomonas koyamae]|uniref:hypothetical protein n=1 Tax=Methylomonas koyamae TaxID=702114 RepID=UPI0021B42D80|nr:hypothetical protein [Methylomonas koyamae]
MNRFRSPAAMGVLGFSVRLGVAFLSLPGPALAAVCTWEGGDSVWSTPGNWSCAAVPGNADDALLNTDNNLDLDVAATVQKFTLASPSAVLQGSGPLTSNSAFDWQSGTVSGSGVLTSNTTYNLQSGSSVATTATPARSRSTPGP